VVGSDQITISSCGGGKDRMYEVWGIPLLHRGGMRVGTFMNHFLFTNIQYGQIESLARRHNRIDKIVIMVPQ